MYQKGFDLFFLNLTFIICVVSGFALLRSIYGFQMNQVTQLHKVIIQVYNHKLLNVLETTKNHRL